MNSIRQIKSLSDLPIVTGFGIKTKSQVKEFLNHSDGVVIASELIRLWNQGNYGALDNFFSRHDNNILDDLNASLKSTLWIP